MCVAEISEVSLTAGAICAHGEILADKKDRSVPDSE